MAESTTDNTFDFMDHPSQPELGRDGENSTNRPANKRNVLEKKQKTSGAPVGSLPVINTNPSINPSNEVVYPTKTPARVTGVLGGNALHPQQIQGGVIWQEGMNGINQERPSTPHPQTPQVMQVYQVPRPQAFRPIHVFHGVGPVIGQGPNGFLPRSYGPVHDDAYGMYASLLRRIGYFIHEEFDYQIIDQCHNKLVLGRFDHVTGSLSNQKIVVEIGV